MTAAVDGPALLAAAVRAAVLAKAPRRTVQSVAAAVAGVLVRPAPLPATPATVPGKAAGRQCATDLNAGDASPEALLEAFQKVSARSLGREESNGNHYMAPNGP